jgi:hypothetical protein
MESLYGETSKSELYYKFSFAVGILNEFRSSASRQSVDEFSVGQTLSCSTQAEVSLAER